MKGIKNLRFKIIFIVQLTGWMFLATISAFAQNSAFTDQTSVLCQAYGEEGENTVAEYLYEFGKEYYDRGNWIEAIREFRKVLLLNPEHALAKEYLEKAEAIVKAEALEREKARKEELTKELKKAREKLGIEEPIEEPQAEIAEQGVGEEEISGEIKEEISEEIIIVEEEPAEQKVIVREQPEEEAVVGEQPEKGVVEVRGKRVSAVEFNSQVSGQVYMSIGFTPKDIIWKRANWDLNEEDWRLLSTVNYDYRHNTYDPAIYDRLRLNLDKEVEQGLGYHFNLTIDPWSFVGKTSKITIADSNWGNDSVDIQLKWWSNNDRTVGEQFWTNIQGDVFSLPEIKVINGKTSPITVRGLIGDWWNLNRYDIPEMDVHFMFRGLREAWGEYNSPDRFKIRVFPIAYQDQALVSDDPLRLADYHIYWEESQWLTRWKPGRFNSGPADYTRGSFDDSLAWIARDSDGTRLTFLRGARLDLAFEDISLSASLSSPMELWQDYQTFDTYNSALRIKAPVGERWMIGGLYTGKVGFNKESLDAQNYVGAVDFSYQPVNGWEIRGEAGASYTEKDRTAGRFATDNTGMVARISMLTSSEDDVLDKAYNQINPEPDKEEFFYKARAMFTRMGKNFNTDLSTYHETRHDRFWSRHIHFNQPFDFYWTGFYKPSLTWDDIKHQRLGDSIDTGRNVGALRLELENMLAGRLDCLFDLRNAYYTNGDYLETVGRLEGDYQATPKLLFKGLGIYHHKPDTIAGIDPYAFDADTGEFLRNPDIQGGENPSVGTISVGAQYEFFPWLTGWGIYEYTNDITVGYDNFPRGPLNVSWVGTFIEDANIYRRVVTQLNNQSYFDLPPYSYYNIFKAGVEIEPAEEIRIGIDWTRNEYEWAGQIDNNINHLGFDIDYRLAEKWNFYLRYVYSKWNDLYILNQTNEVHYNDHHNFFAEARYILTEDEMLMLQYGEIGRGVVSEFIFDPYGGTMTVLDTQHIVRLFYHRRF